MVKHILRLCFSLLLLVYVGFQVDWRVIAEVLGRTEIIWYMLSTGVILFSCLFSAVKFHLLLRKTALSLSVLRLLAIHLISQFFALFLPTALGPEVVRWYKVTKGKQGKSFFLAATVYERSLFMLTLVCFGMIPLLFDQGIPGITALRNRVAPLTLGFSAMLISGLFYLFSPGIQTAVNLFLRKILRIRENGNLDLLLKNLVLKDRSLKLLGLLIFFTLCWQLVYIIRIYCLFFALGISFGIAQAAWMGSLVLLLQVLPVSFAGLGLREGAYAYLFTLYGLPAEQGVVMGLLFFTQMLIFAFIGGVLNLFEK